MAVVTAAQLLLSTIKPSPEIPISSFWRGKKSYQGVVAEHCEQIVEVFEGVVVVATVLLHLRWDET